MDRSEARRLLERRLTDLRGLSYRELRSRIHNGPIETSEVLGAAGSRYQLETEFMWDVKPEGNIRVIISIDDGGLSALHPLTTSFIKAPDDSFVDEVT